MQRKWEGRQMMGYLFLFVMGRERQQEREKQQHRCNVRLVEDEDLKVSENGWANRLK